MSQDAIRAVAQIGRSVNRRLPELERLAQSGEISPVLARELQQLVLYLDSAITAAKRQGQQDLMRGRLR
jgi:hypothetical protein